MTIIQYLLYGMTMISKLTIMTKITKKAFANLNDNLALSHVHA